MVDLESGLVLHLPFSEGSGTKVKDKSKYQNNGVVSGAVFLKPYENDTTDEGEAPLVIYDDDETFWTILGQGVGSYDAVLSEETTIKQKGSSSLKMVIGAGTSVHAGITHTYGTNQDWSTYDFLSFWIYGANTGLSVRIMLYAPDASNILYVDFTDNFSGWRRKIFLLQSFSVVVGSPNLSIIGSIIILYLNINLNFTSYLDRTIIDVGNWRHGEALDFDGINDEVQVTDVDSLQILNDITLVAWIKGTDIHGGIIYKAQTGEIITYEMALFFGNLFFRQGDSSNYVVTTETVNDGNWHHIVVTRTGNGIANNSIKFYIDGVLVKSTQLTNPSVTSIGNVWICSSSGLGYWDGIIDEPRIYNRVLSAEEIRTLYNEKAFDLNRGLVLHLSMEEGSGTKTYDKSKQQNNGTLLPAASEPTWVDGKIGKALNFDGIDDYVTTTAFTGPTRTITGWLKKLGDGLGTYNLIWFKGLHHYGSVYEMRLLWYPAGYFSLGINTVVAERTFNFVDAFTIDQWLHVTMTYDDITLRFYLNGVFVYSTSINEAMINNPDWGLGLGRETGLDYNFDGIIDEVRLYNRVLSSEEIRTLYLKTVR